MTEERKNPKDGTASPITSRGESSGGTRSQGGDPSPLQKKNHDYGQLIPLIQSGAYLVITVAILAAVAWGIFGTGSFFQSIAKNDVARGLITFLIALTTVGIAIILALSTIYGEAGDVGDK